MDPSRWLIVPNRCSSRHVGQCSSCSSEDIGQLQIAIYSIDQHALLVWGEFMRRSELINFLDEEIGLDDLEIFKGSNDVLDVHIHDWPVPWHEVVTQFAASVVQNLQIIDQVKFFMNVFHQLISLFEACRIETGTPLVEE